jgi:hypothetical protein
MTAPGRGIGWASPAAPRPRLARWGQRLDPFPRTLAAGPAFDEPALAATQIASRQHGLDPQVIARAWTAQLRLCGRFRHLAARKTSKNVVAIAIAWELAGFIWAEMTA